MTKLLDDLTEVVRLYREVENKPDMVLEKMAFLSRAGDLVRTHAAEIERNARDAERIRLECEQEFLRDWLMFIDTPDPVCCGDPQVGAEYGGMQEMVCCGCPELMDIELKQVSDAMNKRLSEIDTAMREGGGE